MRKWKTWTEEDIRTLREMWGVYSVKAIANRLGRTESAVETRAGTIGLGSAYTSNLLSANQVSDLLGVDGKTVARWIKKRGLKGRKMAMKQAEMWLVDMQDLEKWLRKNQDRWDSRKLEVYGLGVESKWLQEKRKHDMTLPTKHGQRWTAAEDSRLMSYYGHRTFKEIGEMLGRSEVAIQRRVSRLKETGKLPKDKILVSWTTEETQLLIDMDKQYLPDEEIAWELGREVDHVRSHRRRLRLKGMYPEHKKDFLMMKETKEMSKLLNQGISKREIGRRFNVHERTVARRLERIGEL